MKIKSATPFASCFVNDGGDTKISRAYFEGYNFGDRLMERIAYQCDIENGFIIVSIPQSSRKYMEKFNTEYWLKLAYQYCIHNDMFCDHPSLDGNDVYLELTGSINPQFTII